jgi:chemotaxis family two-component system sensor kinase Cph1
MTDERLVADPLPWEGRPDSVKRHGITITNCDTEPVRTPGCIQAHGALLALRAADLTILQASENTGNLLGRPPEWLLGRRVSEALGTLVENRLFEVQPGDTKHVRVRDQTGRRADT